MADDTDFSTELRVRTRRQHAASDAMVNLTMPLALSSPHVYRLVLKSFYFIYSAMEEEFEKRRRMHPKLNGIYYRQLLRAAAFERDLCYFYGADWAREMGPPSKETARYIAEMKAAVKTEPTLIIAYSQPLCVGLLAGGQTMSGWVRKSFGCQDGQGTQIFDFSDTIQDVAAFREEYSGRLNSLNLDRAARDRIIAQKRLVFAANESIFSELRRTAPYRKRVLSLLLRVVALVALLVLIIYIWFEPFRWAIMSAVKR